MKVFLPSMVLVTAKIKASGCSGNGILSSITEVKQEYTDGIYPWSFGTWGCCLKAIYYTGLNLGPPHAGNVSGSDASDRHYCSLSP